ncbi:MAG TPA: hypothetical protein VG604_02420 [Candidatus Saccharimonadales bacterium]|nr:hypothetical protein [Candidatus Saccharimonadales bacterium]
MTPLAGRRPAIRGNSSVTYQRSAFSLPVTLNGSSNQFNALLFANAITPTVPIRVRGIILQGFIVWETSFPNPRTAGNLRVSLYDSGNNLLRQSSLTTISAGSGAITSPNAYQSVTFPDIQLTAAATYYIVYDGLVSHPASCFLFKNDRAAASTAFTVPFTDADIPGHAGKHSFYSTGGASTDPADYLPGGTLYVFNDPGTTIDFVGTPGVGSSGGFIAAR